MRARADIERDSRLGGQLLLEVLLDIRDQNAALLARPAGAASSAGGPVFPPYGKNKGEPVAGASLQNLKFYEGGCLRTLADPAKAKFHAKERTLLAAIHAEIKKLGGVVDEGDFGPHPDGEPAPVDEEPAY